MRQSVASAVQSGAAESHLFDDLIAQQPAQAGADLGQAFRAFRRDRRPLQKIDDERQQRGGAGKLCARALDITVQTDDIARKLSIAPKAERVAVCVDQVRQRLELIPLLFVVRIIEFAWIGAFARSLYLNETHQSVADGDGEVRTGFQRGERGFSDETHRSGGQASDLGQVSHQQFERRAELVFGRALNGDTRQLSRLLK